jgi:hypothetical protein
MLIHALNVIPELAPNPERGALKHLGKVEGWLDHRAARGTDYLMRYQTARDLLGDALEIGVYRGAYFLVLAWALAPTERAVALDIFEEGDPVLPSAQGELEPFMDTLRQWGPPWPSTVIQADSTTLKASDVLLAMQTTTPRPFRWISVDGSHDEHSCHSDLVLAQSLLMDGGVVALDDWRAEGNDQWPGVIDGELAYQMDAERPLVHVGTLPNKLLLTTSEAWAEEYRRVLRDWKE